MEKKLGDAELKVMQVLWRTGGCRQGRWPKR